MLLTTVKWLVGIAVLLIVSINSKQKPARPTCYIIAMPTTINFTVSPEYMQLLDKYYDAGIISKHTYVKIIKGFEEDLTKNLIDEENNCPYNGNIYMFIGYPIIRSPRTIRMAHVPA